MPSQIGDFINTFLQIKQVQNQTQAIAQQAQGQAIAGVNTFMELARQTADPGQLTALVDRFSQLGVGTPEQLGSILQHVTPSAEATKSYLDKLGVDIQAGRAQGATPAEANLAKETASVQNTGMSQGQSAISGFLSDAINKVDTHSQVGQVIAQAAATRSLTGQTPEQIQQGQDYLGLPQNERTQAAGVAAGTRMSAAQDAQNQLGWAGNRLGNNQLAAQSAYQMGELAVENAKAKAAAMGHDPQIIDNLLSAKNGAVKNLQDAIKLNPTPGHIDTLIGGLNAINAMLTAYGIPNEGQIEYKPEEVVQPGFFRGIMNKISGAQTPIVLKPNNQQPAGAGRK